MQPIYSEVDQHSNIVFKKSTNLDFFQNTENCLLRFDNSCEEIFNDKEFVKLATAGRHKNINVIYVKHNLYQQSMVTNKKLEYTLYHFVRITT